MEIRFKKIREDAFKPTFGSLQAAGADLRVANAHKISIAPHSTEIINTGIAVEIPDGYVGLLCARSGISAKRDLAPANKVGVIDSDYRGEIKVALHNHGEIERVVDPGERIVQLIIIPYIRCEYTQVEDLDNTIRGECGFGSTGTK